METLEFIYHEGMNLVIAWSSLVVSWGLIQLWFATRKSIGWPHDVVLLVTCALFYRILMLEPLSALLIQGAVIHAGVRGRRVWRAWHASRPDAVSRRSVLQRLLSLLPKSSVLSLMLHGTSLALLIGCLCRLSEYGQAYILWYLLAGLLAGFNTLGLAWLCVGKASLRWKVSWIAALLLFNVCLWCTNFSNWIIHLDDDPAVQMGVTAHVLVGWSSIDTNYGWVPPLAVILLVSSFFWLSLAGCLLLGMLGNRGGTTGGHPERPRARLGRRLAWGWLVLVALPGWIGLLCWPTQPMVTALVSRQQTFDWEPMNRLLDRHPHPLKHMWINPRTRFVHSAQLTNRLRELARLGVRKKPVVGAAAAPSFDLPSKSSGEEVAATQAQISEFIVDFREVWQQLQPGVARLDFPPRPPQEREFNALKWSNSFWRRAIDAEGNEEVSEAIESLLDLVRLARWEESASDNYAVELASTLDQFALARLGNLLLKGAIKPELLPELKHKLITLHHVAFSVEYFRLLYLRASQRYLGWRNQIYGDDFGDGSFLNEIRTARAVWRLLILEIAFREAEHLQGGPVQALEELHLDPVLLVDPFSPQGAHFRIMQEEGRLVPYSLGINQIDDQGWPPGAPYFQVTDGDIILRGWSP